MVRFHLGVPGECETSPSQYTTTQHSHPDPPDSALPTSLPGSLLGIRGLILENTRMKFRHDPPGHPIDISEADGIRFLHFGSEWVQGAMRIARPWSLELEYTRDMMAGLLLRDQPRWPRKALLIGLGCGSLAKFLYRHFPQSRITVVEINPRVEFIARQYFRLPDDPLRLHVELDCGAAYLQNSNRKYDLILVDGFDANGRPGMLDSLPFYQSCASHLEDEGIFAVNLLREKGFRSSVERIEQAFGGSMKCFPEGTSGNTIAVGRGATPVHLSLDEFTGRAEVLRRRTRLDLRSLTRRLESSQADRLIAF